MLQLRKYSGGKVPISTTMLVYPFILPCSEEESVCLLWTATWTFAFLVVPNRVKKWSSKTMGFNLCSAEKRVTCSYRSQCKFQGKFVRERPHCCSKYVDQSLRSLTDRQREILQEYADDVDGRSTKKARSGSAEADDSAFSTNSNSHAPLNHANGTTHFSSSAPHEPGDNWLSRVRRKIRELTR